MLIQPRSRCQDPDEHWWGWVRGPSEQTGLLLRLPNAVCFGTTKVTSTSYQRASSAYCLHENVIPMHPALKTVIYEDWPHVNMYLYLWTDGELMFFSCPLILSFYTSGIPHTSFIFVSTSSVPLVKALPSLLTFSPGKEHYVSPV